MPFLNLCDMLWPVCLFVATFLHFTGFARLLRGADLLCNCRRTGGAAERGTAAPLPSLISCRDAWGWVWGAVGHTHVQCVSCCFVVGFAGSGVAVC